MYFRICKTVVFIICVIALTIQSMDLYNDYLDYRTVVTVNIGTHSVIDFPAVSVCEGNHFIRIKSNHSRHSNLPVSNGVWIKARESNPKKFYQVINDVITFDDYLKIFYSKNLKLKDSFGPTDDGFISCIKRTGEATGLPCQPVNYVNGFFSECKSFFNTVYFNDSTKNFPKQTLQILDRRRNDEMAVIRIRKNNSNYHHTNQVTILIIPSNTIPVYPIQKLAFRQNQLKFGKKYDVSFSKATIIKLAKPYKPFCFDYKNSQTSKSYLECVVHCVHKTIFDKHNCLFFGLDMIMNDIFSEKRLCNDSEARKFDRIWFNHLVKQCKHQLCLPDCVQEIYKYEIKDVTDSLAFHYEIIPNDTIIINILPVNNDEFTYIHQPKISRNDFISKLGGLLSLWLGFSFYSVYNHIESFFKKYFRKNVSLDNN